MSKRTNITGFALLVVLLTAGAAQGLSDTNTVDSGDIVDFTIVANDIKTAAIGGRPIVDNSLKTADIDESSLAFPCSSSAGPSFATIDAAAVPISATYVATGVQTFRNCSGQAVQARKNGTGAICVKFVGSTQEHAVVSIVGTSGSSGVDTFAGSAACNSPVSATPTPGQFQVLLRSGENTHPLTDFPFTILAF